MRRFHKVLTVSAVALLVWLAAIFSPSGASAGVGFAIPVDTVNPGAAYVTADAGT